MDVIASKLDNPRHVAVAKDGDVYVAESGRGGDHTTAKSCFDSAEGFACTGRTGAITRVDRRGQRRIVTGLASFAPVTGNSAIGPHGIYADGHDVYFTNGGPTEPTRGGATVLRYLMLVAEDPDLGEVREAVQARESRRPARDRGPVEVRAGQQPGRGRRQPADRLQPGRRLRRRRALLRRRRRRQHRPPGRALRWDPGARGVRERRGPDPESAPPGIEAVPTGVVKGPDGALYMTQLTGFPFLPGSSSVYRIDPRTGARSVYASGFTNAIDLDFGRDGTLYVLEIDHAGLFPVTGGPSSDGALLAVSRRGSRTPEPAARPCRPGR